MTFHLPATYYDPPDEPDDDTPADLDDPVAHRYCHHPTYCYDHESETY